MALKAFLRRPVLYADQPKAVPSGSIHPSPEIDIFRLAAYLWEGDQRIRRGETG